MMVMKSNLPNQVVRFQIFAAMIPELLSITRLVTVFYHLQPYLGTNVDSNVTYGPNPFPFHMIFCVFQCEGCCIFLSPLIIGL